MSKPRKNRRHPEDAALNLSSSAGWRVRPGVGLPVRDDSRHADLRSPVSACASAASDTSLRVMPRKRPVPPISDQPTRRTDAPKPSRVGPKPSPAVGQLDLWSTFATGWEDGEPVQVVPAPKLKPFSAGAPALPDVAKRKGRLDAVAHRQCHSVETHGTHGPL